MDDKTALNNLMDVIINAFKTKYPTYTIGDYEDLDEGEGIDTPAMFIQLANFDGVEDPIKEVFRAACTFRVYICESYKGKAKRRVRDTALDVAMFVQHNAWDAKQTFNNAKFTYATEDEFNEKIESSELWYVEWEQQVFITK